MPGIPIREPMAGDPLSADWARGVARELRAQRLSAMAPLQLTRTPTGTSLSLRGAASRMVASPARAWDIRFAGGSAKLVNCCYRRGPVFVWLGDLDAAVSAADEGDTWLGAEIDTELGTATVISGGAADVYDAAPPAQDSAAVRIPLYILGKFTDPVTSAVSFWVSVDLRNCPAAMLYV